MPTISGPHAGLRHVVPSAQAQDAVAPGAGSRPAQRPAAQDDDTAAVGGRTGTGHAPDERAASEEHFGAPRPAPPPGSPAYRRVEQSWDAADLHERRPAGTEWRSVQVDGQLRRYLVSLPPSLRRPAPLIIAFHGLGQRAGTFAGGTGLVAATRAAGQVLALPESSGPAFNDGRLGTAGPDDDGFAMAVVHDLVTDGLADPRRVAVAGFSNGAGMAMEVAARHPGTVAAVVSICGALIDGQHAPRPAGPVRAYLVHGTADRVQPWNGRTSAGPTWPAYVSQTATVGLWVGADHAQAATEHVLRGGPGRATVTVRSWAAGPSGAAVTFYAIEGMGHRWPTGALDTVDATALAVHAAATAVLPSPTPIPGT